MTTSAKIMETSILLLFTGVFTVNIASQRFTIRIGWWVIRLGFLGLFAGAVCSIWEL